MADSTRWGWSRSNPINTDFATPRGQNTAAGIAVLAALLLHAALVWFLLGQSVRVVNKPAVFNIELIHLPKPVPAVKPPVIVPKIVPKVVPKALPKTIVHVSPVPVDHVIIHETARHAAPRMAHPPQVMHFSSANSDTGLGLDLASPNAGTGQGSLGDFEDSVKRRIEAAKTYPPGLPPAYGLTYWNQCVISYRVTVARNGALISYKLYGCGNPFLDAATRAAILMAAPYPVPPDFGGTEYDVYGSLIFKKP